MITPPTVSRLVIGIFVAGRGNTLAIMDREYNECSE
jgi:hypothetical protein